VTRAATRSFREAELIHGRWAMLGAAGALAVEALGYGNWVDAELTGGPLTYFGKQVCGCRRRRRAAQLAVHSARGRRSCCSLSPARPGSHLLLSQCGFVC
jgi:hypothetical protein